MNRKQSTRGISDLAHNMSQALLPLGRFLYFVDSRFFYSPLKEFVLFRSVLFQQVFNLVILKSHTVIPVMGRGSYLSLGI